MRWYFAVAVAALTIGVFAAQAGEAQPVAPVDDLLTLSCKHAEHVAAASQLGMTRCRKVGIVQEGQFADVTIRVWIEGQGQFIVRQSFILSGWAQSSFSAVPVG